MADNESCNMTTPSADDEVKPTINLDQTSEEVDETAVLKEDLILKERQIEEQEKELADFKEKLLNLITQSQLNDPTEITESPELNFDDADERSSHLMSNEEIL